MTCLYELYSHVDVEIVPRLRSDTWIVNPAIEVRMWDVGSRIAASKEHED